MADQAGTAVDIDRLTASLSMAGATRLYLIRHGETPDADRQRFFGHLDVEMTPQGEEQMVALARRLAAEPLRAVYCSDLKRTVRGAELIAAPHRLTPYPLKDLREIHFGHWEGLSAGEIRERFPGALDAWLADYLNCRVPGGETLEEMEARVLQAAKQIIARHPGEKIALVGHSGTNRLILCHALHLRLDEFFRLAQDFAALNVIAYTPERAMVELMNG